MMEIFLIVLAIASLVFRSVINDENDVPVNAMTLLDFGLPCFLIFIFLTNVGF